MHWNASGLMERVIKGKIERPKKQVEEPDKFEISSKDKSILLELKDNMERRKNALDSIVYKHYLEEYLTIRLKPILKKAGISIQYPYYRVIVKKNEGIARNYIACEINIYFYYSKEQYNNSSYSTEITVELQELFNNCSSVVINRLRGNIIQYSSIGDNITIANDSKLFTFVKEYMNILEDICNILNYSVMFYSSSLHETPKTVNHYLENNWKVIKEFKNKRNSHTIRYYTKDL